MKKTLVILLILASVFAFIGCTAQQPAVTTDEVSFEDGTYRGTFADSGYIQVNIQFKLVDNKVTEIEFRHLEYKGVNYLKSEEESVIGLKEQYQELNEYLVGKDIRESLSDLYKPADIVTKEVDAFTGATVRASKVISAIRDALNRGVYSY